MRGREKIEAAFSPEGTPEIPAVICYEGIYIRDHWAQLTSSPWWHQYVPDVELQMAWRREVIAKTGQDWFVLPDFYSLEERKNLSVEVRPEGVFCLDRHKGSEERLVEPRVGGWTAIGGIESVRPAELAQTPEEIDKLLPVPAEFDPERKALNGQNDLAFALLREYGDELFPIRHVSSPLWSCYSLWGFEGMMSLIATRPDLVAYACGRALTLAIRAVQEAAACGVAGIWIEECLTDIISPHAFASLNVPFVRRLVEEIRSLRLKSIYYYCGDPAGKWEQLLAVGADALSLEESKKGFTIDIEDVVERVHGRLTVLGNLDAIGLLEKGSEEALRAEIARQIAAGRRNGSRFIMSLGSPVTPATTVERVRLYCDLVHELGQSESRLG